MLDVHPPEHGIHGGRDFALHLLTITIGLLIALGLESAAEAVHHRHQREEAEAAIRQEIRENIDTVNAAQTNLRTETTDLIYVLGYADARIHGEGANASKIHIQLTEGPLKDAAWRTAAATGVAQYMSYDTAEKFAACYKEQDQYEAMEVRMLEDFLNVESFAATKTPDQLSTDELRDAIPFIRKTLADLGGTRDIGRGLTGICKQSLN